MHTELSLPTRDGAASSRIALSVNGESRMLDVEPRVSLLDALREHLGLTGSKKGCDQGTCGACTVWVDGRRVLACLTLAMACEGREITTIEGLPSDDEVHPRAACVHRARRLPVRLLHAGSDHVGGQADQEADARDPDACERVVDGTVDAFGRLDVLVNMASVYRAKSFDELTVADWDASLEIDLRSAWLCARAAAPHMRRLRGGRIINFADWTARSGRPRYTGYLPYYVAKAAVVALTEALALELASDQILVNAIAPGPIVAPEGASDEEFAAVERVTPLGRWGGEAEIAKAVLALIDSDFVTGETIRVDGGRHLK